MFPATFFSVSIPIDFSVPITIDFFDNNPDRDRYAQPFPIDFQINHFNTVPIPIAMPIPLISIQTPALFSAGQKYPNPRVMCFE